MKNTDKNIASGLSELVSPDTFEKISARLDATERTPTVMKKKTNILRIALPAVAACLILMAGVFGVSYYDRNMRVDSVIDIDVNPGIELSTNKKDRVIDVHAVNDDATAILDGMNLENTDLKVAVNALIGSMVQKGYVTDEMSGILVTVKNSDSQKADTIRAEVVSDIDAALLTHNIDAPVINQTLTDTTDAESFAKEHGISFGKAVFVRSLAAKDASLDAAQLAGMTIRELTQIVVDKKLDISDIADYDHDDSIWENIEESIEEVDEDKLESDHVAQQQPAASRISEDVAKARALAHAGVAAADARFDRVELDADDGVVSYEIEFYANGVEYEYDIKAADGTVIKAERDYDDDVPAGAQQQTQQQQTALPLNVNEAKARALAHAGVSAADAVFEKAELDEDDGIVSYEIEFRVGKIEYEYNIKADDGTVLKAEKDIDD